MRGANLRADKYEVGVSLYWVEDEVEGEFQKAKSWKMRENVEYAVDQNAEDIPSMADDLNLDPSNMRGPGVNMHQAL